MHLTHRPARGNINTPFGPRPKPTPSSPAIHYGQDYGWGGGDEIYAARSGRVKSYAFSGAYGNRLVIDHGDGTETWYCHIRDGGCLVSVGELVEGGEQVAWMGATGNVVGKHLHFEVRINGTAVDPAPYFNGSPSFAGGLFTELEEIDMATAQEIAQAIWTHMLTQTEGQKASGRAADWLVNAPDQVGPNVWDHVLTHPSGVQGTAAQWAMNTSDMVGKILSRPSTVIDPVKLAAALKAAGLAVTIDSAALVKALDASLSDNFANIPGAVRNAIVK